MKEIKYLQSLEKFGIHLGLERITYLLKRLGNPHRKFKSIHVAGTNGKGSTAAMIASILKKGGYKVGLYTSPHLFDYTERIKINEKEIPKAEFNKGLKQVEKISKRQTDKPTIFEVLTAVAFWYFAKKKIDYAVVEVGMGGRLDATNVITPLVTIITNIDFEHIEVLGNTLEKIAWEKAGVIKLGVPVVTAETNSRSLKVIKEICEEKNCLLIGIGPEQAELKSKLLGQHQRINAACAISAIRLAEIKVPERAIAKGLMGVSWPGRFQVLSRRPLIVVDGAHNPAGARALRVTIKEMFPGKYTLIFGCQERKDFQNVIKELKPVVSKIIITKSSHNLAADPRYIFNHFRWSRIPMSVTYTIKEAFSQWDRKNPLLISGSLFLIADSLKLLA